MLVNRQAVIAIRSRLSCIYLIRIESEERSFLTAKFWSGRMETGILKKNRFTLSEVGTRPAVEYPDGSL